MNEWMNDWLIDWMDELIEKNKNINRGYRKLIVWKEAIGLYVYVSKKLEGINNISFKVKDQVEASAFSVHSNIAEGYARRSLKENINFNNYALGSLAENYSQIYALLRAEKIDRKWFDIYDSKHFSLENKLIAYNKSQIKVLKEKGIWNDDYTLREKEADY